MEMIDWIESFLVNENSKLLFVFGMLCAGSIIDFLMGVTSAALSDSEQFSSRKLKRGLAEKVMIMVFSFFLIPVAVAFKEFGVATLYMVYTGFIVADISSMIGHIRGNGSDSKGHEGVFKLIESVLKGMFGSEEGEDK